MSVTRGVFGGCSSAAIRPPARASRLASGRHGGTAALPTPPTTRSPRSRWSSISARFRRPTGAPPTSPKAGAMPTMSSSRAAASRTGRSSDATSWTKPASAFSGFQDDLRYRALAVAQARAGRLSPPAPRPAGGRDARRTSPGSRSPPRPRPPPAQPRPPGCRRVSASYRALRGRGRGGALHRQVALARPAPPVSTPPLAPASVCYTNSDGDPGQITFRAALSRLADLSFDPYHCPERRWGAGGVVALRRRRRKPAGTRPKALWG